MSAEMQFAAILSINIFRALEVGLLNEHDSVRNQTFR